MDHPSLKKALRKELLEARMTLDPATAKSKSKEIFERWRNRFTLRQVAYLHVFQSMLERREVDTAPVMSYIRNKHSRIHLVVPVIDKVHGTLRHAMVSEGVELVKNRFGVPEPTMPVEFVYPVVLDMVLVPMLGFDLKGYRLGYGKGYYDKFLQLVRPKCLKIGLCFELGKIADGLPAEAHDVPLDFVVTEAGVYRTNESLNF